MTAVPATLPTWSVQAAVGTAQATIVAAVLEQAAAVGIAAADAVGGGAAAGIAAAEEADASSAAGFAPAADC